MLAVFDPDDDVPDDEDALGAPSVDVKVCTWALACSADTLEDAVTVAMTTESEEGVAVVAASEELEAGLLRRKEHTRVAWSAQSA